MNDNLKQKEEIKKIIATFPKEGKQHIRNALTGKLTGGPPLYDIIQILGPEESALRMYTYLIYLTITQITTMELITLLANQKFPGIVSSNHHFEIRPDNSVFLGYTVHHSNGDQSSYNYDISLGELLLWIGQAIVFALKPPTGCQCVFCGDSDPDVQVCKDCRKL